MKHLIVQMSEKTVQMSKKIVQMLTECYRLNYWSFELLQVVTNYSISLNRKED